MPLQPGPVHVVRNAFSTKDEVFDWMIELGDGLEKKGLVLIPGPGKPEDLYAKPKDD